MASEVRPAELVQRDVYATEKRFAFLRQCNPEPGALIESDRAAVRAEVVGEIAEWVADGMRSLDDGTDYAIQWLTPQRIAAAIRERFGKE